MDAECIFFFQIESLAFHSSIQIIGPSLNLSGISPACLSPRGEEGLLSLELLGRETESIGNFLLPASLCLPASNLTEQAGIWQAPSSQVLPALSGELSALAPGERQQCRRAGTI